MLKYVQTRKNFLVCTYFSRETRIEISLKFVFFSDDRAMMQDLIVFIRISSLLGNHDLITYLAEIYYDKCIQVKCARIFQYN